MQIEPEKEITLRAYHQLFGGKAKPQDVEGKAIPCFEVHLKDGESIWATKVVSFAGWKFRVYWHAKAWCEATVREVESFNAEREES